MNKKNIFVRGMAIFLVVILVIGVVAVGISALAVEDASLMAVTSSPDTGSRSNTLVIIAIVAALILMGVCIVLPKLKKKDE